MNEAGKSVGETPRRYKCGDIRSDGMVFVSYGPTYKNGERWVSPKKFQQRKLTAKKWRERNRTVNAEQERERCRIYYNRNLEKERHRKREYSAADRRREMKHRLKRQYGITLEDYETLLIHQGGGCAICQTEGCSTGYKLAVDHDHENGVVRGLLCMSCNTALGRLNDSTELLLRAVAYLENPPTRQIP